MINGAEEFAEEGGDYRVLLSSGVCKCLLALSRALWPSVFHGFVHLQPETGILRLTASRKAAKSTVRLHAAGTF